MRRRKKKRSGLQHQYAYAALYLLLVSCALLMPAAFAGRRARHRTTRPRQHSPRGRGSIRCPGVRPGYGILLSRTCRRPATKQWCLKPMQSFTYQDVKDAGEQDVKLKTEFAYSTAKFAINLDSKDGDLSRANLNHYILHKGNRFATYVLERTGKFNRGKLEHLLDEDLPKLRDWSTCAVFGSSNSLLKHNYGKDIDKHTAVFRFNEAPTKGFEKHVGSKTTIRCQNPERQGFAEGNNELCLTKHYSGLSNSKKCKLVPLSPQFIAYSRYYWWWNRRENYVPSRGKHNEERLKMSTGFLGISLALHLCKQVTVYGFRASGKGHYYNKTNTRGLADWHVRHPWKLEKDCTKILGRSAHVKLVN